MVRQVATCCCCRREDHRYPAGTPRTSVDGIDASTLLYVPQETVYEFVHEFSGATDYSPHLDEVRQYGDGDTGTDYEIEVSWWRLSYVSHTRVTDTDRPRRIDWRTTRGPKARGYWGIESETPPAGRDHATRLRLRLQFDPETLGSVPLGGWTLDRLFDRIKPLVVRESERIVEGVVRDLEGESRPVDLDIHRGPELV
jgi:hypothetical protein